MKNRLLALDASSTEIGIAVFDLETKELKTLSHFTHKKENSLLEKGKDFKKLLEGILLVNNITQVVIEAPFVAMYGGASSAHTTALLNQVNAMYQWICYDKGLKVDIITPQEARRFALPGVKFKHKKSCGLSEKEQTFVFVVEKLGESYFPKKVMKSGKRKGEEVFEDYSLDMSDAYVVGMGFMNKNV